MSDFASVSGRPSWTSGVSIPLPCAGSRRRARLLASFALATLLAGCQGGARVVGIGKPAVHVGSTRMGALLLPPEFWALHAELEKLFNQPVVFDPIINGAMIGRQLNDGRLQFAIMSAREFAEISEDARVELVATGLNSAGRPARKALIVANAASDVKTLADCKGRRFAFGPSGDLLLDKAALAALARAGVAPGDLKRELPPISLTGRLNALGGSSEIAKLVAFDGSVPAGVVDEVTYASLPESGGSLLTGASRDQLRVLGETEAVPEMAVVASAKADPTRVQMLREYLLSRAKNNAEMLKQLGVSGFGAADETLYADARRLLKGER